MLKQELKKLFLKQHALLATLILIILQCIIFSFSYKEIKFSNEFTKENYYEYMEIMQGKINIDKEKFILNEQEKIIKAEADLKELHQKLYSGEIKSGNEYTDSIAEIQNILNKKEAFEIIFNMYKHAKKAPEKRLILSVGKLGFCRDYPDIPILIFIIAYTSINLLIEESSQMITLIRTCENNRKNAFISKLISLDIMIFIVQLLSAFCEYLFLYANLKNSINYPIQSLNYFSGCEYNITILQGFLFVQLIKLLGYFFISALIIFLSVTVKKTVPVVSIPLMLCLIQQFVFFSSDQGYYIPTGLLRASGYFKGNIYEIKTSFDKRVSQKVFSAIPQSAMICMILFALIFIFFAYIVGYRYYKSKRYIFKKKLFFLIPLIVFCMTGCTQSNKSVTNIYYNMCRSGRFPQNENYYFDFYNELSDGSNLIAVSKSDDSKFKVLRNTFNEAIWADSCCIVENELYIFMYNSSKSFTIFKINLDTYKLEEIAKQDTSYYYSFLGLKFSDSIIIDKSIHSFFTDEKTLFLMTVDNEIFKCDMDLRHSECIISDGIYKFQLVFTGKKIYYINNKLELVAYDVENGNSSVVLGDITRSFDLFEDNIIYSGNDGIYCFSLADKTKKKMSDMCAEKIMVDRNKIVFLFNDSLYLLNSENEICTQIYNGHLVDFNIIEGKDLVLCTKFLYDSKEYEQFTIKI